jgi:hypothetical protein
MWGIQERKTKTFIDLASNSFLKACVFYFSMFRDLFIGIRRTLEALEIPT